MNTDSFNWQTFKHGIILDASIEEVFYYVSTSEGLCKWFIGSADFTSENGKARQDREIAQAGDYFQWAWKAKDFRSEGRVLNVEENHIFESTFGTFFEITFRVIPHKNRTRLELTQRYRPDQQEEHFAYLNCCVCWTFFMTNLKSVVEHGNDLREVEVDDEMLVNR